MSRTFSTFCRARPPDGAPWMALAATTVSLLALPPAPATAGSWATQYQTAQSDTAIVGMAAATEDKAVGFGVEPDGQGNSKPVWFRTSDGGKSWNKQDASAGGDLLMLSHLVCPSSTRCWAVGMKILVSTGFGFQNVLIGSTNGGDAWFWPPPLTYSESRIAVRDSENFYLVGGSVVLPFVAAKAQKGFVPDVGGEKFQGISDAAFVGATEVFLANGEVQTDEKTGAETILPKGALLHSTDGGATWTAVFQGRTETVDRVWFFSSRTGFIVGRTAQGPFIRRTDDGGQTWFEVLIPTPSGVPAPKYLMDAVLFHAGAGLFVGSDKDEHDQAFHVVYRMRDGHTLIEEPKPSTAKAMFTLTCPSQKVCWLAGENHVIWRFDGTDDDVVPEEPVQGPDVGPGSDSGGGGKDAVVPDGTVGDGPSGSDTGGSGPQDASAGETGGSSGGGGGCSAAGSSRAGWLGPFLAALTAGIAMRARQRAGTRRTP